MSEFEKQKQGDIYDPADADIQELQVACLEKMYDYNATRPHEAEQRQALMKEMLAEVGEGCYIEPPLHANFGGHYLHLGHHVYANFNLTLVDDTDIYIGDYTMLGPNVVLAATGHPVLPALRRRGLQFSMPIHIGKCCWLGAGVIVMPGITIGDNTVIGAGSIVTHDIPANVVAVGNPCHVMRQINEQDYKTYFKGRKIPEDLLAAVQHDKFREMRRIKQQLPMQDAERILREGKTAIMAVQGDDGYPYTVPLNYVYMNGRVYIHSAKEGHKMDALHRSDKVTLTVIEKDDVVPEEFTTYFRSVIFFGRARILTDDAEIRQAATALGLKYNDNPQAVKAEIDKFWNALACIEITPEHITAKECIELVRKK
ncbi:MAG: pyridoxamine 5'-phosphate oxidase family protein [Selenomonas sp.]|nr:pyridoxamine 5'-phosphate oxidase family protein [Selenomonas sp.]